MGVAPPEQGNKCFAFSTNRLRRWRKEQKS
jgi:hypothetical protein